jgi:GTP cyclohydrolase I
VGAPLESRPFPEPPGRRSELRAAHPALALPARGDAAAAEDPAEHHLARALEALGLDLGDPHLRETPRRVVRALRALVAGQADPEPELRSFPNPERHADPVVLVGIPFHSLCAHHLLPFFGEASVAYLPGVRLVGLSKPARVVAHFARRLQIQERLTGQIADCLDRGLGASGIAVRLRARHLCMEMRGVQKTAWTLTSAARGPRGAELLQELCASAVEEAARGSRF